MLTQLRCFVAHAQAQQQTATDFSSQLSTAEKRIVALENAYQEQSQIVIDYENGMHDMTQRLRNYIYEQQQATTGTLCAFFILTALLQKTPQMKRLLQIYMQIADISGFEQHCTPTTTAS